jgi:glyoxylase-like metal-dependent hydrolase (beta-lactamase superfamily II)
MRPFVVQPINGTGGLLRPGRGVLHCLLIDTGRTLILVDTGFGTRDCIDPSFVVRAFTGVIRSPRDIEETAVRQVAALGYDPEDVRHIVMTHLHLDHAGGLPDFPEATVHVYADEYAAAMHPASVVERWTYRQEHWAHGPRWGCHSLQGDRWYEFESTPPLELDGIEIRLIPLTGHTRGHCMVAVRLDDHWLLHCGDGYGYHGQIDPLNPHLPPYGRIAKAIVSLSRVLKPLYAHAPRLQKLLREDGDEVQLFCSHDPHDFDRFEMPA